MPYIASPSVILGEYEKFLIYGDYGTGKTQIALSAPDPIWALGVGGKNEFKTLYSKHFLEKVGRPKVYFDFVTEQRGSMGQMMDNPTGFDEVCHAIDRFVAWDQREGIGIKSVVIDNATILESYMMNKAIAAEFAITTSRDKQVLTTEREYGIRRPHDTTWSGAQSLMDRIVTWLFELPYHVVLVAHERKEYRQGDDQGKKRSKILEGIMPLFVGQQRIMIPNMFDNVFRTTTSGGGRGVQYFAQTVAGGKVAAKIRVGGILDPDSERDLNLTNVIKLFKEHADNLESEQSTPS